MTSYLAAPALGRLHGALGGFGGGGLAHWLVRLFIWHLIWRFGLRIWHIHTYGPIIIGVIVLGAVVLALLRSRNGPGWWRRSGSGSGTRSGDGDAGPRDW